VLGFGGTPGDIVPSATGNVPGLKRQPPRGEGSGEGHEYTGKVDGVIYDRFGDFEGFLLLTEHGEEHRFHARECKVEELARLAWKARMVITVIAERHDSRRPVSIILRRGPYDQI
jgi:hypothetical protein